MSEYSGFILVNRYTLGPISGVGLHNDTQSIENICK